MDNPLVKLFLRWIALVVGNIALAFVFGYLCVEGYLSYNWGIGLSAMIFVASVIWGYRMIRRQM